MKEHDFANLDRKALFITFEEERHAWLEAGMDEAQIFIVHFGEDGNGGDYATWLSDRKHTRTDHKYCPGRPLSIEEIDPDGCWVCDPNDKLEDIETQIDLAQALKTLTKFQRYNFEEVCLNGRTYRDVATECGKHYMTIAESVRSAKKKLEICL